MNIEPYDKVQDARSESRYTDDPRSEPDTGEVKDRLASLSGVEVVGEHRVLPR